MATTPTNKPIPSEDPRDLKFNAGKIDEVVNSGEHYYTDRFGVRRFTIAGFQYTAEEAISKYGYITMDSFEDGATLTLPNQTLRYEANGEYYRWDGDFPKIVPAGSTPDGTGEVKQGAWVSVGDASLRSNLSSTSGATLIGIGDGSTLQEYVDNCQYVDSFQSAAALSSVRSEVKKIVTLRYYASLPPGAFHTHYSGNTFIRSGTGTPGETDGGSYFVLSDGSKWVSCLPIHVDRFGACGGVSPVTFDSGPAFQKAVIAVGKSLYASSGLVHMNGPVYNINTKVLWPSNVTFVGNQTSIISSPASSDYIIESGYFSSGELVTNWGLDDTTLLANAIVTDSRFLNTHFIGIDKIFNLRGFTIGCAIGSESKCVTFTSCGTCVNADMSFYSAFHFFVRGEHATSLGQYATNFGHQCNLNRINVTYADRAYGTTLSEPVSVGRPTANMQLPDFSGSSFEGIAGIGVLLRGTTYGVKLDNVYVENVAILVAKDTGNFKTYDMSLNHDSWNFGVTKLLGIAGANNIKIGLSNQSGDYPKIEFVSASGLENTGEIDISGKIGLTASKLILDMHDDIKLNFRYEFRGYDVIYASPEAYVVMPNVGYQQFNYTLKAFDSTHSIIKSGIASIQGVTSLGTTNAYISQNPDGSIVLHFTGLDSTVNSWLTSATFVVSTWS